MYATKHYLFNHVLPSDNYCAEKLFENIKNYHNRQIKGCCRREEKKPLLHFLWVFLVEFNRIVVFDT